MDDKQLRNFLVIATSGSFSKAADKLFISAPALKGQIDRLEAELGVRLFHRDFSGLRLTQEGISFQAFVSDHLAQLDAHIEALRAMDGQPKTTLRLGFVTDDINDDVYPDALARFTQAHPDVEVEFVLMSEMGDGATDEIDLAICTPPLPDTATFVLCEMPLYCLVPKSSPLASREALTPNDLTDCRLSLPPKVQEQAITPSIAALYELPRASQRSASKQINQISYITTTSRNTISVVVGKEPSDFASIAQIPLAGYSYRYELRVVMRPGNELALEYARTVEAYYREHA